MMLGEAFAASVAFMTPAIIGAVLYWLMHWGDGPPGPPGK